MRIARRRTALLVLAGALLLLALAPLIAVRVLLPAYVRDHVLPGIENAMGAELVVGAIAPRPFTGSVDLKDVVLRDAEGQTLASCRKLTVQANPLQAITETHIRLRRIRLTDFKAQVSFTANRFENNWSPLIQRLRTGGDQTSGKAIAIDDLALVQGQITLEPPFPEESARPSSVTAGINRLRITNLDTSRIGGEDLRHPEQVSGRQPAELAADARVFGGVLSVRGKLWPDDAGWFEADMEADELDVPSITHAITHFGVIPSDKGAASLASTHGRLNSRHTFRLARPTAETVWSLSAEGTLALSELKNLKLNHPRSVAVSADTLQTEGAWRVWAATTSTARDETPVHFTATGDTRFAMIDAAIQGGAVAQGVIRRGAVSGIQFDTRSGWPNIQELEVVEPDFLVVLPTQTSEQTTAPEVSIPAEKNPVKNTPLHGGLWDDVLTRLYQTQIRVKQGRVQLGDPQYPLAAPLLISKLNLESDRSNLALQATAALLDQAPFTAEVQLTGDRPSQTLSGNLRLAIETLPLEPFSHYAQSVLLRPIASGTMSLNLPLALNENKLDGFADFGFQTLRFGAVEPSVQSNTGHPPTEEGGMSAADSDRIVSAMNLLRDKDGVVRARIQITGDLTNPELSIRGLIMRATGQLVQRLLTSPLDLIASVFGGEPGVDYSTIQFLPGTTRPFANDQIKLKVLADTLNGRPELTLTIVGAFHPTLDRTALRKQEIEDEFFDQTKDRMSRDFRLDASPGFGAQGTAMKIELDLRQLARQRSEWVADQLTEKYRVNPDQLKTRILLGTTSSHDQQAMVRFELPPSTGLEPGKALAEQATDTGENQPSQKSASGSPTEQE